MNSFLKILLGIGLLSFAGCRVNAQENPLRYLVNKLSKPLNIDGRIDRQWRKAAWTDWFQDIEGSKKPKPHFKTRVKMLWDSHYLYILAEMEEPDLFATLTQRDAIIYRDPDFEVFLDPNNDQQEYFEFEINALGTVLDLFMPKPYYQRGSAQIAWNAGGLKSAVALQGTLNQSNDRDKGWRVEMAIAFNDLERPGRIFQPRGGSQWRINFSRVQWRLQGQGNSYTKLRDEKGRPFPEYNWVWSPQGIIDMHRPQYWGYLIFNE